MNESLTLLVAITAQPAHADEVKTTLTGLLSPTRAEDGCLSYNMFVEKDHPNEFLFTETWATRGHWEAHNGSAHLKPFIAMIDAGYVSIKITEMNIVDV